MSDPILREARDVIPLQDDALLRRAMKRSEREGGRAALRVLPKALGLLKTIGLLMEVGLGKLKGAPFRELPKSADRRDALSRKQAGDAILLWRALRPRVGDAQALALTQEIMTAAGVVFLHELLGDLDKSVIQARDEESLHTLSSRTGRFFNAEGSLRLFKSEPPVVQFAVSACRFVPLLESVDAAPLKPLFCAVDSAYFSPRHSPIRLQRDRTIAGGDAMCDFRFGWSGDDPSPR